MSSFVSKFWNQARRIDLLERELEYTHNLLDKETQKNALLESALTKEYSDHKKTLRRVADQACKQIGLPQVYVRDGEEKPVIPPPSGNDSPVSELVLWQAQEQRNADIEAGITPAPIDYYVSIIKENPTGFIIG